MTIALWVVQILLAVMFAMAGFTKASQPIEKLKTQMSFVKYTSPGIVLYAMRDSVHLTRRARQRMKELLAVFEAK